MTVEEGCVSADQFPVGLRVLAVDDDRSCLMLLENLLRRCQYHVTTTNQAIVALKLLRENKDKFDLVISDVHMPDMDGFKLLELVGLEMDLPVIMLSGNSDPKAVMKGITHGACDYLLKPVRIEELKNIWQHVLRRKKFDTKSVITHDQTDNADNSNQGNSEVGHGSSATVSSERNGKMTKKRKDQNEEDDYDCDEGGHEKDDPSMQKKPRVVWSIELHRKFVAAVNQLGIDKAMPKRILDLMNVEKLTRENVASHLQKYRLYLKRISSVASHQANVAAALGVKDSSYFQAGSLDGVRNYLAFAGSGQFTTLASFQQGAMLGRLNSPTGSGLYSLASPRMIQLGPSQNNSSNSIHDLGKLSNISFSGTTGPNLIQGIPTSLENQFQEHKAVFEPSSPFSASMPDAKFPSGNSNNSFINPINGSQIHDQRKQVQSNEFDHLSSAKLTSMRTDPFDISSSGSYLPDLHRCKDAWSGASTLAGYSTDASPLSVPFAHEPRPSTKLRESISPVLTNMPDAMLGREFQCQGASLEGSTLHVPQSTNEIGMTDVGSMGNSRQRWEGVNQDLTNLKYKSSSVLTSHDSMNNGTQSPGFANGIPSLVFDMAASPASLSSPMYRQSCDLVRTSNDQQVLELTKLKDVCNSADYNPFDELMSAIIKREQEDILVDGDIGCDMYPLGTCI